MARSGTVLALAAVFQVVLGGADVFPEDPAPPHILSDPRPGPLVHPYQERIPRHCWAPPAGVNPYQCCPIPKLYPDEAFESCGIPKAPADGSSAHKPTEEDKCQQGLCLMRNSNLLKKNDSIDYDKVRTYISKWADAHPDFSEAILIARDLCVMEGGPPMPPKICDADKIFFCLTSQILWNCKLREEIESCQVLKAHMDECRIYYMQPKDEGDI